MAASCGTGTLESDGLCYQSCASGTLQSIEDPTTCYRPLACPADTTASGVFPQQCVKTAIPIAAGATSCSVGYTRWTANTCYVNCPNTFQDLGSSCFMPGFARSSFSPRCQNFLFTLGPDRLCAVNYALLISLVICALIVAGLCLRLFAPRLPGISFSYCLPPGTAQLVNGLPIPAQGTPHAYAYGAQRADVSPFARA